MYVIRSGAELKIVFIAGTDGYSTCRTTSDNKTIMLGEFNENSAEINLEVPSDLKVLKFNYNVSVPSEYRIQPQTRLT